MFQDEARFGRINDVRRCWAPKPVRPLCQAMLTHKYTQCDHCAAELSRCDHGFGYSVICVSPIEVTMPVKVPAPCQGLPTLLETPDACSVAGWCARPALPETRPHAAPAG